MDRPHSNQLRLGRFSERHRLYLLTSTTLHRALYWVGFTRPACWSASYARPRQKVRRGL